MGSKPQNISASRGAAVLGLSNWSTPFNVWQKICEAREPGFNADRGYTYPEYEESAVLRWGKAFEDAVIKLSEEAEGTEIIDRERLVIHSDYITCHIDGAYNDISGNYLKLHEGKTAGFFYYKDNFGKPGTDRVPPQYGIQCQHQMACTGADEVILSVLVFPRSVEDWEKEGFKLYDEFDDESYWSLYKNDKYLDIQRFADALGIMGYFHQYPIKRNQELIDLMIEKYTAFWTDYVLTGQEPEPQNYDDIKRMLPSPKGTLIATEQIERWCVEYKECGAELGVKGNLQKRREQLKILILDWMRKQDPVMDEESREKTILKNTRGHNLVSFNGSVFR